jgi:hypothetical protein
VFCSIDAGKEKRPLFRHFPQLAIGMGWKMIGQIQEKTFKDVK